MTSEFREQTNSTLQRALRALSLGLEEYFYGSGNFEPVEPLATKAYNAGATTTQILITTFGVLEDPDKQIALQELGEDTPREAVQEIHMIYFGYDGKI